MTDTMTHSSKIPQCSKRQLLRKGVLNSLLVSALGLYVATTPPTFAMESGAADSGNASAPTAHASALEISDAEKAGWKTWIQSQGKSMDDVPTSTPDLESFRDASLDGWSDFLAQHGPALLAREPYYQAGGAPEPLLQTLKSIQRIMFSMAGDGEGLAETGFRKFIDPWIRNKSSMSTKEKITRSLEFIDSWIRNNSMSTKKKITRSREFYDVPAEYGLRLPPSKCLEFLKNHVESLPLDEPRAGQKREGFTAAIDPFLALVYATATTGIQLWDGKRP